MDAGGYARREFWNEEFVKDGRTISWEAAMAEFRDRTGRPGPSGWEVGTYPAGRDQYPVGGVSWYESGRVCEVCWEESADGLPLGAGGGVRHRGIHHAIQQHLDGRHHCGRRPAGCVSIRCVRHGRQRPRVGLERDADWLETVYSGWSLDRPRHAFQHPEFRSPFDRSDENGFRLAEYLDSQPLPAALTGPIPLPARDYTREVPVSDDVFRAYEGLFAIDPESLDPKVESIDSTAEGWSKEKVSFTAGYGGERVPAYLFLPRNVSAALPGRCLFPGRRCGGRANERGD